MGFKFSQKALGNLKEYLGLGGNDTQYDEAILLYEKFLSTPIMDNRTYVFSEQAVVEITEFFEEIYNTNKWKMEERLVSDVENFLSAILYVVNKRNWIDLNTRGLQKNLDALYDALKLEKDGTVFKIEELRDWKYKQYQLVYKMYHAEKNGRREEFRIREFMDMVACLYSVYFGLLNQYSEEIQAEIDREMSTVSISWDEYCKNVTKHTERVDDYVLINCKPLGKDNLVTTDQLPENVPAVVLAGDAAIGKTTALEYLQYIKCKRYLEEKKGRIPVLIRLRSIRSNIDGNAVINMIKQELGLDRNYNLNTISSKIEIYFDGYNEVPDTKTRKNVQIEIQSIINDYKIPVFVTDRSILTKCIPSGITTYKYTIESLKDAQVREYFTKKTKNEAALKRILDELDATDKNTLKWTISEPVKPYQLNAIIDNAVNNEKFHGKDKTMQIYLRNLLDRECDGQKDEEEVRIYKKWLRAVAVKMSKINAEKLSDEIVESLFDPENMEISYSEARAWASEMPIIEVDDNDDIKFVDNSYVNYFVRYVKRQGDDKKVIFDDNADE